MNATLPTLDLALLIEAAAAARPDPLRRFVDSLTGELRTFAEETIRMREELVSNVQRMLTASNPREAAGYAEWVTRHSHEVAYRWCSLMRAVTRWSELDLSPFPIHIPRSAITTNEGTE